MYVICMYLYMHVYLYLNHTPSGQYLSHLNFTNYWLRYINQCFAWVMLFTNIKLHVLQERRPKKGTEEWEHSSQVTKAAARRRKAEKELIEGPRPPTRRSGRVAGVRPDTTEYVPNSRQRKRSAPISKQSGRLTPRPKQNGSSAPRPKQSGNPAPRPKRRARSCTAAAEKSSSSESSDSPGVFLNNLH